MSVGSRLKSERERLGLKQTDLADTVEINRVSQSNYERDITEPKLEYWEKLDALGFDIYFILTGKYKNNSE